jgi:vacuolar-type H+-ATPase subunit D/Vma8
MNRSSDSINRSGLKTLTLRSDEFTVDISLIKKNYTALMDELHAKLDEIAQSLTLITVRLDQIES